MSREPQDWQDVTDWEDVGPAPKTPTASPQQAQYAPPPAEPDYVKGIYGYIQNPRKPGPLKPGAVTARDEKGKVWTISVNPMLPPAMTPGIIEGHIRNKTAKPSVLDRLKSTPLDMLPFMGGQTVGNLAEGFKGSLPSLRNTVRTGGAIVGGTAGAIGGAPSGPGAILTAGAGGAAGAAGADALLNTAQAVANRYDTNPLMGKVSELIGKPPATAGEQLLSNAGAAAQGALQEGGGAAAGALIGKASKALAERQVQKLLQPSTMGMKADVEEVSAALASDMPKALTDKSLLNKINTKASGLGQAVDDAYTAIRTQFPSMRVRSAPIIKALQDAKKSYMVQGNAIPGLEPIVKNYDDLIAGIGNNSSLTVDEFRKIKQGWDEAINWSRSAQARTPAMEKALTDGANAIRDTLHTISPSLQKADEAYSLWKTAQDAMQHKVTAGVGSRSALVSNSTISSGIIGAGIGTALGGTIGAGEGAAAAEAINMLMGTTAYRTMSLATKKQIENLVSKKMYQKAIGLILAQGSVSAEEGVRRLMTPPVK